MTAAGAPLLRVRDLGRDHGEVVVLDGLDLDLSAGGCVALVGMSGGGKSTALRCLAGQLVPTRGTIELAGTDVTADPSAGSDLRAAVPDPAATPEALTVREQLAAVAAAHGAASGAVDEVLDLLGLTSRQDLRHHQLSRGLRRRAELACGLARPAQLLLLDEPTGELDERSVEVVVRELGRRLDRGVAVVLATHDPDVARYLADEVLVLEDGRVADRGAPDVVLAGAAAERAGLA